MNCARWWWVSLAFLYCIIPVLLFARTPSMFSIPDERAMQVAAERVAQGQPIAIPEPLNALAEGLIHPRSMTVVQGAIVPEGFIALPLLYGWLMRLLGWSGIPFVVVPLSTVIAAFYFGQLLRSFFRKPIPEIAPLLYLLVPPILYYSFHPYLGNLLQWNLLVVALALFARAEFGTNTVIARALVAGLLLGIVATLRPVEIPWIAALVLILAWRTTIALPFRTLAWVIVGILPPVLIVAHLQQQVYGHWWSVGYASNPMLVTAAHQHSIASVWDLVQVSLFPFGLSIHHMLSNIWYYHVWMFWWIPVLSLFAVQNRSRISEIKRWIVIVAVPILWLMIFYGSWGIHEQADPSIHAMSTGFVRYWIPVATAGIPLIAIGFHTLVRSRDRLLRPVIVIIMVLGLVLSPLKTTIASINEQWKSQALDRQRIALVTQNTPANAIVIVKYSDKVYYPARRVIVWYPEPEKVQQLLPALIKSAPIFLDSVDDEGTPFSLPGTVAIKQTIALSSHEQLLELMLRNNNIPRSTPVPPFIHTLSMPFTAQAPEGNWNPPFGEYCEEASAMMAAAHFLPLPWTIPDRLKELQRIATIEAGLFGASTTSTNSVQTAKFIEAAYPLKAMVVPYSREGLQNTLRQGHPVMLPFDGALLGNPFFRTPPPVYHMLVVRGVTPDGVVTNDPGTRHGESFEYAWTPFEAAIGEWSGKSVDASKKFMIIVNRL